MQNLNLAAKLKDQDKIVVQTEEELQKQNENMNIQFAENASITNASESMNSTEINEGRNFASGGADHMGQVNINSATKEELQTIKGVGPAMAGRILEYRRSNGGFSSVEDLKNVKGIGEKTFAKLRDSVRI